VTASGSPGVSLERGGFRELEAEVLRIRDEVFVRGMGVPVEIEHDSRDPHCFHVLARVDGSPAATGRLDFGLGGKVGRVAVLRGFRGRRLGAAVMDALEEEGRSRGLEGLWCHAQLTAAGFYRRLGWTAVGEEFIEAGIRHVRMEKTLGDTDGGASR
jgi:predicted GNAT family N-acyltransferase